MATSSEHPYSLVMRSDDWVFVSGAAGIDYSTHIAYTEPMEAIDACLDEVLRRLATVGCNADNIVKLSYSIADVAHRDFVNVQYAERFADPKPARTVLGASGLPYGALVVIDCTARADWNRTVSGINENSGQR